jgi:hypothetical protein
MRQLPQAVEIIFEVQRKMSNGKIVIEKEAFSTHKTCFFFSLDPSNF